MNRQVLFVDDDKFMLESYRRKFITKFNLELAADGFEGLEKLSNKGPFAVIITDFRMPKMDGVEFLSKAQKIAKDTSRIILTGQAGFQDAVNAVNEGKVFRFLCKPCSPSLLENAVEAGIEQYRLINLERELLENTLSGSVKMLSEILSLSQPEAFSKGTRLQHYVCQIAKQTKLKNIWLFKLAALLSQIGFISLSPDVIKKLNGQEPLSNKEKKMVDEIPNVAYSLLKKIPRLESIAEMVKIQYLNFNECQGITLKEQDPNIAIGGQLLKIANDYDTEIIKGANHLSAVRMLIEKNTAYNPDFIEALQYIDSPSGSFVIKTVGVDELHSDMILQEDIRAKNGHILVPSGYIVNEVVLKRIQNFSAGIGVIEPFQVKIRKIEQ